MKTYKMLQLKSFNQRFCDVYGLRGLDQEQFREAQELQRDRLKELCDERGVSVDTYLKLYADLLEAQKLLPELKFAKPRGKSGGDAQRPLVRLAQTAYLAQANGLRTDVAFVEFYGVDDKVFKSDKRRYKELWVFATKSPENAKELENAARRCLDIGRKINSGELTAAEIAMSIVEGNALIGRCLPD